MGSTAMPRAATARMRPSSSAPSTELVQRISPKIPWYLGKLAGSAQAKPTLRRLIDNQQEFITAFEEIVQRPHEQEEVLREMTVRCLAT